MKFLTPNEVRVACPELDTTATLKLADYEKLVGETAFARTNFVECQLIRADSKVCRTPFGSGWVARRKDGVAVYIGGDCANNHAIASGADGKRYQDEAAALARANRISLLQRRIDAHKADDAYLAKLNSNWERAESLEVRCANAREQIPDRVCNRLFQFLRGISRDVPGEARYVEKEEDPNDENEVIDVVRWRKISLGSIRGIEGLDVTRTKWVQQILRDARQALRQSAVDEKRLEKFLTNQVSKLDAAVGVGRRLDEVEESLAAFHRFENFRALCWIAIRDDDREAVVAHGLRLAGRAASLIDVRATVSAWRKEIEDRHGGRIFRAIQ
jgi:hypothetical protein